MGVTGNGCVGKVRNRLATPSRQARTLEVVGGGGDNISVGCWNESRRGASWPGGTSETLEGVAVMGETPGPG